MSATQTRFRPASKLLRIAFNTPPDLDGQPSRYLPATAGRARGNFIRFYMGTAEICSGTDSVHFSAHSL